MNPQSPTQKALRHAFSWRGRAKRSEAWGFFAAFFLAPNVLFRVVADLGGWSVLLLYLVELILLVLLTLALIRRAHDLGHSALVGIFPLIVAAASVGIAMLLPVIEGLPMQETDAEAWAILGGIGFLISVIIICSMKGMSGPNPYGPNPSEALQ